MKLKRFFIIVAISLTSFVNASAQGGANCSLKSEQMPQSSELFGLRLGLTVEQVKALVPTLQLGSTDEFGLAKTSFSPEFHPAMDKIKYQGVRTVSLEFQDGRVSSLWIGFNESYKWKTLDEFMKGMSAALGLPDKWETKTRGRFLDCNGFEAALMMIANAPSIRLTDNAARELWEQRRTEKEETQP
jgi:hypothetical protein